MNYRSKAVISGLATQAQRNQVAQYIRKLRKGMKLHPVSRFKHHPISILKLRNDYIRLAASTFACHMILSKVKDMGL